MAARGAPPLSPEHNIGVVESGRLEEAIDVLEKQGIRAEPGVQFPGFTGIRVAHADALFAGEAVTVHIHREELLQVAAEAGEVNLQAVVTQ